MAGTIGLRLCDEDCERLDAFMEREGIASRGLAVKRIVEERLAEEGERDSLEPLVRRIEERLAQASQRGTKASIAALCLLCAGEDEAMRAKLSAMPAGAAFDYAWDMAGVLMSHGSRPDFYRAAKASGVMQARERSEIDEVVAIAAGCGDMRMATALDGRDLRPWFEAKGEYDAVREIVEGRSPGTSDEWFAASRRYSGAVKKMADILANMGIRRAFDARERLGDLGMAYSHERGDWFNLLDDVGEAALRRRRAREVLDAD